MSAISGGFKVLEVSQHCYYFLNPAPHRFLVLGYSMWRHICPIFLSSLRITLETQKLLRKEDNILILKIYGFHDTTFSFIITIFY